MQVWICSRLLPMPVSVKVPEQCSHSEAKLRVSLCLG